MTNLVDPDRIEGIVGARRHETLHIGRAVSAEQTVYILHSQECKDSGIDLRSCEYSVALDRGIDPTAWVEDEARLLSIDLSGSLANHPLPPDSAPAEGGAR